MWEYPWLNGTHKRVPLVISDSCHSQIVTQYGTHKLYLNGTTKFWHNAICYSIYILNMHFEKIISYILSCPSCVLVRHRNAKNQIFEKLLISLYTFCYCLVFSNKFENITSIRLISPGGNVTQDADYNFLHRYFWLLWLGIQRGRIQSASVQFSPDTLDTLAFFWPVVIQNTIINVQPNANLHIFCDPFQY